jgi:hypothetical protein
MTKRAVMMSTTIHFVTESSFLADGKDLSIAEDARFLQGEEWTLEENHQVQQSTI